MQATTIDPVCGEVAACEVIAQNSLERAKQKTPIAPSGTYRGLHSHMLKRPTGHRDNLNRSGRVSPTFKLQQQPDRNVNHAARSNYWQRW
jgi:hypothetical protein